MRCQKLKPFLNQACASLCDLEYTYKQQLFWEDINKSFQKYLKFIWKVIQYQFCVLRMDFHHVLGGLQKLFAKMVYKMVYKN